MYRKRKSGQIFTLDTMIALIVFVIILFFFVSFWNMQTNRMQENTQNSVLLRDGHQFMQLLISSRGEPENWPITNDTVIFPGLMEYPGYMHPGKVNALFNLNYNVTRVLMNVERYEYELVMFASNGAILNSQGINASNIDTSKYVIERNIIVDNETRKITLTMWKP